MEFLNKFIILNLHIANEIFSNYLNRRLMLYVYKNYLIL